MSFRSGQKVIKYRYILLPKPYFHIIKKKKLNLGFFKRFITLAIDNTKCGGGVGRWLGWGGQYKQVFTFFWGVGGGRKEPERNIYAKIYK